MDNEGADLTHRFETGELRAMVFDRDEAGWFYLTQHQGDKIRTPFAADRLAGEVVEAYGKGDRRIGIRTSVFGPITMRMVLASGAKDILWLQKGRPL